MKISLIICTYMRPLCVERLLSHLVSMDKKCDELIIVDASDNDFTERIVRDFSDRLFVKYCRSERGLTYQRNIGLGMASGDIVGFFDDDMIPDYNFFQIISDLCVDNSDIYGLVPYIYESNSGMVKGIRGILLRFFESFCGKAYLERICGKNAFNNKIGNDIIENVLANGCTFYRREIFDKFQFAEWMHGYCYGEDIDFGLRVASEYKIAGIETLRAHHWHESSGRNSDFQVTQMRLYNFVRIIDSMGEGNRIVIKTTLAIRIIISVGIGMIIDLLRFRLKKVSDLAGGVFCGTIKIVPVIFKNQCFVNY